MEGFVEVLKIILNSAVLVAVVAGLFKYYQDLGAKKKTFSESMDIRHQVGLRIELFRVKAGLPRVVILKGENGGRPRPESSFYSTVIHEAKDEYLPAVKDRWQKQRIDSQYEKILHKMFSAVFAVVETKDMEEGILKDSYLHHKMGGAVVALIHENSKRMIYLSLGFNDVGVVSSHDFRDDMRVLLSDLKKLYK